MGTSFFASFSCFFWDGKCQKLLFWHIFGRNSRTKIHVEILIKYVGFLDWFYIWNWYIICEKILSHFFSKTKKLENVALPVLPIILKKPFEILVRCWLIIMIVTKMERNFKLRGSVNSDTTFKLMLGIKIALVALFL